MAPSLRSSSRVLRSKKPEKECSAKGKTLTSKNTIQKSRTAEPPASIISPAMRTAESSAIKRPKQKATPPNVITPFGAAAKRTTATAWTTTPIVVPYDRILPYHTVKAVVADYFVRILGMPKNNHALGLIEQKFRFQHSDRPWIVQVMEDVRTAYEQGKQYDYTNEEE